MKNVLSIIIMFLLCSKTNGQTILKESFYFENKEIFFSSIATKKNGEFNFIIKDTETDSITFYNEITKCKNKAPSYPYFIFIIPKEFSNKKEKIVLEFISYVLSKRKLLDLKMNILSDENYFTLYEQTRINNRGKYKTSFLNRIHKLTILKSNDSICQFLK